MNRRTPVFFVNGRVLVWTRVGMRQEDKVPMYKRMPPSDDKVILTIPSKSNYVTLMDLQSIEGQGGL